MKSIKISTIYIWFAIQTILSVIFYYDDKMVSGIEALITFLLSFPLTIFILWIKGDYNKKKEEPSTED